MTEPAKIIEQIRPFVEETFYLPESETKGDDAPLFSSGLLDSADLVTLLMFLEETFDISIEDGDVTIERFDTYNSMATYVKDCLTK